MRFFLLILALALPLPVFAAAPQGPIAHATLLADTSAIAPGTPFHLGVLIEPKSGWHTYWENPGDAGIATTLTWTLPKGFSAGNIDWPVPTRITEGPLVIFGYTGNTLLPVSVTPPPGLSASAHYIFTVKANWLICKDICIPESADLNITLPAGIVMASRDAPLFTKHEHNLPTPLHSTSYQLDEKAITLIVPLAGQSTTNITNAFFMPRQENIVRYASAQTFTTDKNQLQLKAERSGEEPPPADFSGLLVVQSGNSQTHVFDIKPEFSTAPMKPAPLPVPPAPKAETGFFLSLLLAIVGGLILNLMPCVLPVLSLKALAIAQKANAKHTQVVRLGIAYTLGVLVTFGLFAGLLLTLRSGGQAIGWGYQMQSPAFVAFLIYLLFLVGLNLSGLFHLPVLLGNVGSDVVNESSAKGSFFTGALAVMVATPCTAPFMAGAVGAALTLPSWQAMLIFEALGFGLALPFLLISIYPKWLKFLPKPGRWMETFKELLAFPMYAAAIWLLWVLAMQTGGDGVAVALSAMLAIALLLWMKRLFSSERAYRAAALIGFALVLALSIPALSRLEIGAAMPAMDDVKTIPFSPEKLSELHAAGTPVLVDATAAWCITCQVNLRTSIHTARTMQAMQGAGAVLMVADWTRRNPEISTFLQSFGFSGVPLVVFYPAHGEPTVLPQILTESIVINTINGVKP